jgi:hypothetical protein
MTSSIVNVVSKKSIFVLVSLFFACHPLTIIAQRSDFSGSWKLDTAKSEFGNVPMNSAVKQFEIEQTTDSISIKRITINDNNEESTTFEKLSIDGKPGAHVLNNNRTKTSSITWTSDGQSMTTVSAYSLPDKPGEIEYQLSQTWKLAEGGKELIISLTSPGYTIKAVYDKE